MEYNQRSSWLGAASAALPAPYNHTLGTQAPIIATGVAPTAWPAATLPPKGTWFDEAIDLRDPEGEVLTHKILDLVSVVDERTRKRRPNDEANHRTIVRKILANSVRCLHFRKPSLVAYLRKADGYSDKPLWLSGKAMARTVDIMEKAGLVETTLGEQGSAASTYELSEAGCQFVEAAGVTHQSVTCKLPLDRLVRLREGNSTTPLINFAETDETRHWTALLETYNSFLTQHDIALALTPEEEAEWTQHLNEATDKSGMPFRRPERFKTDLYRQFNNGSFDEGGRMYGGWWIGVPKTLRRKITINGQPTTELDFSGCAVRMLYHARDIDYPDDPYGIDAIASCGKDAGLSDGHFREGIKAMMQALLNDKGSKPENIALPNGLSFKPYFKRPQVRQMIEEKHTAIADHFGTGVGLRLQRQDSDLALAIVTDLREQGIVALPIHDSFIVPMKKDDELKNTMIESYKSMFGHCPTIN